MPKDSHSHFATAVCWPEGGVLLRGGSGSGKSDLALRLIRTQGACLVADDRVNLSSDGDQIYMSCPEAITGLIEIRGLGLFKFPYEAKAALRLIVDVVPNQDMPRLPEPAYEVIEGQQFPKLCLSAFEASAAERVALAFTTIGLNGFPEDAIFDLASLSERKQT
jgi:HPr kinase/phosphorylase